MRRNELEDRVRVYRVPNQMKKPRLNSPIAPEIENGIRRNGLPNNIRSLTSIFRFPKCQPYFIPPTFILASFLSIAMTDICQTAVAKK